MRKLLGVALALSMTGALAQDDDDYLDRAATRFVDPLEWRYDLQCHSVKRRIDAQGETLETIEQQILGYQDIDYASWLLGLDFIAQGNSAIVRQWVEINVEDAPEGTGKVLSAADTGP